jgi:hypothetical protein
MNKRLTSELSADVSKNDSGDPSTSATGQRTSEK